MFEKKVKEEKIHDWNLQPRTCSLEPAAIQLTLERLLNVIRRVAESLICMTPMPVIEWN